jgi:hypothetical protein
MNTYGRVDIQTHKHLGTSWRRSASPRGKSPRYPLDRRLGGSQSRSGRRGENSWPYGDSNSDPSIVQSVASHTDCAIPALCVLWRQLIIRCNGVACIRLHVSFLKLLQQILKKSGNGRVQLQCQCTSLLLFSLNSSSKSERARHHTYHSVVYALALRCDILYAFNRMWLVTLGRKNGGLERGKYSKLSSLLAAGPESVCVEEENWKDRRTSYDYTRKKINNIIIWRLKVGIVKSE